MSEIQHTSLKGELLYLIGRASAPLTCTELYEKCELAEEVAKVAKALSNLRSDGKIVRVDGPGQSRDKLADGIATPAPAGKKGRSKAVQKDDAAGLLTVGFPVSGIRPAPEPGLPALDIPTPGDPSGKTTDEEIAKTLDQVEAALNDSFARTGVDIRECLRGKQPGADAARLADAILARLKRELAPTSTELEAVAGLPPVHIHIHIEQIDFHLGGL